MKGSKGAPSAMRWWSACSCSGRWPASPVSSTPSTFLPSTRSGEASSKPPSTGASPPLSSPASVEGSSPSRWRPFSAWGWAPSRAVTSSSVAHRSDRRAPPAPALAGNHSRGHSPPRHRQLHEGLHHRLGVLLSHSSQHYRRRPQRSSRPRGHRAQLRPPLCGNALRRGPARGHPHHLTGLRISLAVMLILTVVTEMVAGSNGIAVSSSSRPNGLFASRTCTASSSPSPLVAMA